MSGINTPIMIQDGTNKDGRTTKYLFDARHKLVNIHILIDHVNTAATRELRLLEDLDSMGRRLADMSLERDLLNQIGVEAAKLLLSLRDVPIDSMPASLKECIQQVGHAIGVYNSWRDQQLGGRS